MQDAGDLLHQVALAEIQRRQVHCHGHRRAAFVVPVLELAAGALQHPAAERADQAMRLGEGDELVWPQQPPGRVLPAHQGLQAGDAAIHAPALGLVMQHKFTIGQGLAQLAFHVDGVGGALEHDGREELVTATPVGLGVVHRCVGMADQVVGVLPVDRVDADADGR